MSARKPWYRLDKDEMFRLISDIEDHLKNIDPNEPFEIKELFKKHMRNIDQNEMDSLAFTLWDEYLCSTIEQFEFEKN